MFYVPSFICGTLIGGSIAYVFLRKLADNGMLTRIQAMLDAKCYGDKSGVFSNSVMIAAFGAIFFVVIKIAADIFHLEAFVWSFLAYASLGACAVAAVVYFAVKKGKEHQ